MSVGSYFGSRWPIRPPARVWPPNDHQTMTMTLKQTSWSYVNFHLCLQDLSHRPPTQHQCLHEIFVYSITLFCWPLTISVASPRMSTPFENFHCTGRFNRKLGSNHANAGGSSGLLATFQTIFDPIPSASLLPVHARTPSPWEWMWRPKEEVKKIFWEALGLSWRICNIPQWYI